MHEHRKGLNRTLFWLYRGAGTWPYAFRWALLVFDVATIVLFVVHPVLAWRDAQPETAGVWWAVDIVVAAVITADFAARWYIERDRVRFLFNFVNLADLLVVATLLIPLFAQNLNFLRVLRAIRLVRAFEFFDRHHMLSRWLHLNSFVVSKLVNLIVFLFVMAALVFVNQVDRNPSINSYLDALYFTVTSLTTTGYGDVLLEGADGRWISIAVMVLGVTLFIQLIRAIAVGDKLHHDCPKCELDLHDRDAAHCKRCGAELFEAGPKAAKAVKARSVGPPGR